MTADLVGLAFGAGLVAALNPCGFAMLPAYLALVARGSHDGRTATAVMRSLAATIAMTLGFVAVFGVFTLLTVSAAGAVQRRLPYVTVLIGVALIGVGGWLLTGRPLHLLVPNMLRRNTEWAPTAKWTSMFGYGAGYAIASLSCTVAPFLAVTAAGLRSGSTVAGVAVFAAYTLGFALIVGTLAVAVAVAGTAMIDRMRRILPYVNRIGGALLIVIGCYVAYYGSYEIRLFAGGGSDDPVIAGVARFQGAVAGWVHLHGAWPWLAVLALTAVALVWRARAAAVRRRSG